jgi:hypothetical protein
MADDYFTKLGKRSQPVRDLFKAPKAADAPAAPTAAKPPTAPKMTKEGELQGESLEDYTYMRDAVKNIGKKLAPKSVMGKSSSKR